MEQWLEIRKSGNFDEIGKTYGIHPIIARILRNREITKRGEIEKYLYGTMSEIVNPYRLKHVEKAAKILKLKIQQQKKIRIIGDYDIDGIQSTYILFTAIQKLGGAVDVEIPDRIKDGYGVNEQLIEQAIEDKIDTIITCDNGIAAKAELEAAKKMGMSVIITDHHEVPYIQEKEKIYIIPNVDAVVDPKQEDCQYPYKEICGAVVAWRLIQVLYDLMQVPITKADEFIENAAFATVGDVMELRDENRILVKEGLKQLNKTSNIGMRALISANHLEGKRIKAYHIGFVLGPCLNASGRLDTAKKALRLLCTVNEQEAKVLAKELTDLNETRKEMTRTGVERAIEKVENSKIKEDKVLVLFLEECHESLAGIIAGRIRERYHRPVFILTQAKDAIKGSGRSIEAYSMYEELRRCEELLDKFGGHPMAAGVSLQRERIDEFRERLNQNTILSEADIRPSVKFDAVLKPSDWTFESIQQLEVLEPFGKGNEKPVFAAGKLRVIDQKRLGEEGKVFKLTLLDTSKKKCEAIYFGDADVMEMFLKEKQNEISILYYPQINTYQRMQTIQLVISSYC